MRSLLKIGELSHHTGCPVETIRYYEREGLLDPPLRSRGNFRLYDQKHTERLNFIRHCRSLDMTLSETRTLLKFRDVPEDSCQEVNALLDKHIGHVVERIAELSALQNELNELRSKCGSVQTTRNCGILQGLSGSDVSMPKNLGSHGGGCH
ncbi:MAG: Cd(II)/Pb(II)-responsive transcriptional regulator [Burkholderiales bacterium]